MEKQAPSSLQSETVTKALYDLSCQWNIEPAKMFGKRESLDALYLEIGWERFTGAIKQVLAECKSEFCPSIGKIREYIPHYQRETGISPAEWKQLNMARDRNPDDFFGIADVICMLRAQQKRKAEKKPLFRSEQLRQITKRAKQKYGRRYEQQFKPAPQPVLAARDEVFAEDDYL